VSVLLWFADSFPVVRLCCFCVVLRGDNFAAVDERECVILVAGEEVMAK
jgi:hypothetical protein